MNVFLELTSKTSGPRRVRLKSMTVIGRSKQCQLRISSTEVSREHCQIAVTHDGAFLVDLGSSNGTEVDGQLIKPGAPIKLTSGMKLSIGPAQFVVNCVDDASATAGDSSPFLIGRANPMSDTALISSGPTPTKLEPPSETTNDADKQKNDEPPWPRAIDAITEVMNTVNDDEPDESEFPEWNMNVIDERSPDAAASVDEAPATKPKKPFSLFSLLKRSLKSSEAKLQDGDGTEDSVDDSNRHDRSDKETDNVVPIAHSTTHKNAEKRPARSDDDLDEFLKQLS